MDELTPGEFVHVWKGNINQHKNRKRNNHDVPHKNHEIKLFLCEIKQFSIFSLDLESFLVEYWTTKVGIVEIELYFYFSVFHSLIVLNFDQKFSIFKFPWNIFNTFFLEAEIRDKTVKNEEGLR